MMRQKIPDECNVFGIPYRTKCISFAIILLMQNACLEFSFPYREQILVCDKSRTGLDSFLFQYGKPIAAYVGLYFTLFNTIFNWLLLIGCLKRKRLLLLLWIIFGGIVQLCYLTSFQAYCLYQKSCLNCEDDRFSRYHYSTGFTIAILITLYCFVSFIFYVYLYYKYLMYLDSLVEDISPERIIRMNLPQLESHAGQQAAPSLEDLD